MGCRFSVSFVEVKVRDPKRLCDGPIMPGEMGFRGDMDGVCMFQ